MSRSRPMVVSVVALCLLMGCAGRQAHELPAPAPAPQPPVAEATVPVADFVVLPASGVGSNTRRPKWSWEPTRTQVIDALSRLPEYLRTAGPDQFGHPAYQARIPGLVDRLPGTLCQAYGARLPDGQRAVFLNFFPIEAPRFFGQDWRTQFVGAYDGGPRFWSVWFIPTTGEFRKLRIDLG